MPDETINCSAHLAASRNSINQSSPALRLQPILSSLETWGFGFSGLLLWLGPAPAMHAALGPQAIAVWLPGVMVGMLLNLQVKRLGTYWVGMSGGTPNYTARLLEKYPRLAAYSAIGYFFGWAAVPLVNAIILTDLIKVNLNSLGLGCPELLLKVGFTLLAFVVAFSGTRALGILHFFFIIPAMGFLLAFCAQGIGWLIFSPTSPGFFPGDWVGVQAVVKLFEPLSFTEWAKWFFITVYAVYACETASSFVADSRRPSATLRCLSVTAWLIPLVYLGGSWVLMRLAPESEGANAFLNLLGAATPFWGQSASLLVTFLIASSCLLSCATGFSNAPRILYQLSLDGYLSPVFAIVSRRSVLGPALLFTLLLSLVCVVWGDVSRVVMVTGTGFFASIMATHWGLWLNRGEPQVRWAWLSLGFFTIELVALVVGGIAWDWQDLLVGLLLPVVILVMDAAIRQIPLPIFQPNWWIQRYQARLSSRQQDFVGLQVGILLLLVCSTSLLIWNLASLVEGAPDSVGTNLFVVLLLTIAFAGIAIACWTSLPQVTTIVEAREQAEQVFTIAFNAILVLDGNWIIRQANPAAERLFGATHKLVGRRLNQLLPDFNDTLKDWNTRSELTLVQSSQPDRAVEVAISDGSRHGLEEYVVILRDITDYKQAEAELRQTLQTKETLAATATAQAQQLEHTLRKLQQTQAQLVQTEKMSSLGQLVAGVAHEINNPVNFIYGNLTYVSDYANELLSLINLYRQQPANSTIQAFSDQIDLEFLAEDLPKTLASMKVGVDRIRQIVLSLRNFSRLDQAEMKAVDIHEGIDSTLLILQNRLKSAGDQPGIEIIKHYGNVPLVECYAGQLNQVFMNLLSNAIDALYEQSQPELENTTDGMNQSDSGYTITICTAAIDLDWVRISIQDNGPGIAPEIQSKLFDPFFTTKPTGQGTGLGLSISYQIITEKHGGRLTCVSEPGQGAAFLIEIPMQQPSFKGKADLAAVV